MKTFSEWAKNKNYNINENILATSDVDKELELKSLIKLEKSLSSHALEIDDSSWQKLYQTFIDCVANPSQHEQARTIGNLLSSSATTGNMDELAEFKQNS